MRKVALNELLKMLRKNSINICSYVTKENNFSVNKIQAVFCCLCTVINFFIFYPNLSSVKQIYKVKIKFFFL